MSMFDLSIKEIASAIWGWKDLPVTQDFGVYNPDRPDWYGYAEDVGHPFGTHVGVDVAMPLYTPIHAGEAGTVEFAGWSDSWRPNPVTVRADDGSLTVYGHLHECTRRAGSRVNAGDLLGYSGEQTVIGTTRPDGSGPHLHLEKRDASGRAVDPFGDDSHDWGV